MNNPINNNNSSENKSKNVIKKIYIECLASLFLFTFMLVCQMNMTVFIVNVLTISIISV